MPPPADMAGRVIFRMHVKMAVDPYFSRVYSRRNHQTAHLVRPRPAAIIRVKKRNAGWRYDERVACSRADQIEHVHGLSLPKSPYTLKSLHLQSRDQ